MHPPEQILRSSTRLSLEEFQTQFAKAWTRVRSRFLKLECWQSYREGAASRSQQAYELGHTWTARRLLREEAEADRPLYEDIGARSLEYARIRLVQEPLTPYLEYELMSYEIRAEMGENIEIVRLDPDLTLPNDDYFDFLLFDQHTALIHDYGDIGLQSGGWITHHARVLDELARKADILRKSMVPLRLFLLEDSLH